MDESLFKQELSKYNKYILDKIIKDFDAGKDFNIYALVEESVSYKCILPSQNELVMETYYTIKEYLIAYSFIIEKKEMTAYLLTGKGIQLKTLGSIEKYEEQELRKNKKSIFQFLFKTKPNQKQKAYPDLVTEYYE
jgi:hypothetical protein